MEKTEKSQEKILKPKTCNSEHPVFKRNIAYWLFICCFMIFVMVAVGGVTRLTNSGLSIVEWKPVTGIFPPANENEWQEEFNKYRRIPEYQKINYGMTLEEFKKIYWNEYIHRLLGRITGAVFLIPFLYFFYKKQIDRSLTPKLIVIFALGGLQGAIGWFMVKSGLSERTDVSQYRLVLHLITAILLYSFIFWVALGLYLPYSHEKSGSSELKLNSQESVTSASHPGNYNLKRLAILIISLILLQIIAGGFVAGTDAGLVYNTFPLMNGEFIPGGFFFLHPWYINFFENHATIQFTHRIIAYLLTVVIFLFLFVVIKSQIFSLRKFSFLLTACLLIQVSLGIMTLILNIPLILASFHQVFAIVLLSISLIITHKLCYERS